MIAPPKLRKGDKIGIVAPAGKPGKENVMAAMTVFHKWGLEVELGKNVFKGSGVFSGTDEERIADLQGMLDDPSIKVIISARGGYGTLRIIDKLDFTKFCAHPKWIIGYSDITVLHSHIHKNCAVQTIHGTMAVNFAKSEEAVESLRKVLFDEELSYTIAANSLNREGLAEGEVIGGNLTLLYAQGGSNSDIDTTGKILFIEDLGEFYYNVDRMMMNLKRSGKLNGLAGLVVGGMTEMKDSDPVFGKTVDEIIFDAVSEYKYPVCFGFPAGHIEKNLALVFGRRARLSVTSTEVKLSY